MDGILMYEVIANDHEEVSQKSREFRISVRIIYAHKEMSRWKNREKRYASCRII